MVLDIGRQFEGPVFQFACRVFQRVRLHPGADLWHAEFTPCLRATTFSAMLASCSWSTNLDAKLFNFPVSFSFLSNVLYAAVLQSVFDFLSSVFSGHTRQFSSSSFLHFVSSTVFRFSAAVMAVFAFWEEGSKALSLDPSTRVSSIQCLSSERVDKDPLCVRSHALIIGTVAFTQLFLLRGRCRRHDLHSVVLACSSPVFRSLVFRLSHSSNFRCVLHCPVF